MNTYQTQLRRAAERQLERTILIHDLREDLERAAEDVCRWSLLDTADRRATISQLRLIAQRLHALAETLASCEPDTHSPSMTDPRSTASEHMQTSGMELGRYGAAGDHGVGCGRR